MQLDKTATRLPSVYCSSQLGFAAEGDSICTAKTEVEFHLAITDEVNDKIRAGRAVIVFFDTTEGLERYTKSTYGKQVAHHNVLNEKISPE